MDQEKLGMLKKIQREMYDDVVRYYGYTVTIETAGTPQNEDEQKTLDASIRGQKKSLERLVAWTDKYDVDIISRMCITTCDYMQDTLGYTRRVKEALKNRPFCEMTMDVQTDLWEDYDKLVEDLEFDLQAFKTARAFFAKFDKRQWKAKTFE